MNPLLVTVPLLLGSAVVIYLACEYFVNGVEWVGRKFAVGQQATGTILAAFGTALPESVVTFVAVVFGVTAAQKEIGVGAALGGPLVLATIAYATVGLTLILTRKHLPRRGRTERLQAAFARPGLVPGHLRGEDRPGALPLHPEALAGDRLPRGLRRLFLDGDAAR
jgi:cation:H+ antiporter